MRILRIIFQMLGKTLTIIAVIGLLVLISAGVNWEQKKNSDVASVMIESYLVFYYTRFNRIPTTSELEELQADPAVREIFWVQGTRKECCNLWYHWHRERGYILDGVMRVDI